MIVEDKKERWKPPPFLMMRNINMPSFPSLMVFFHKKIEKQRSFIAPQALSGDTELTARAANVLNSDAKVRKNSKTMKFDNFFEDFKTIGASTNSTTSENTNNTESGGNPAGFDALINRIEQLAIENSKLKDVVGEKNQYISELENRLSKYEDVKKSCLIYHCDFQKIILNKRR